VLSVKLIGDNPRSENIHQQMLSLSSVETAMLFFELLPLVTGLYIFEDIN